MTRFLGKVACFTNEAREYSCNGTYLSIEYNYTNPETGEKGERRHKSRTQQKVYYMEHV